MIWFWLCRSSRSAHQICSFHGFEAPIIATSIAAEFVREIVRLHGFPTTIISDRDKVFMSLFWHELFHLHMTSLRQSTSYHPQKNGQTEVVNKTLRRIYIVLSMDNRGGAFLDFIGPI